MKDYFKEPKGYELESDFKLPNSSVYNLDESNPDVKRVERLFNTKADGEGLLFMNILTYMRPLTTSYEVNPESFEINEKEEYCQRIDLLHKDLLNKSVYDQQKIDDAFNNLNNIGELIRLVDKAIPVTRPTISKEEYNLMRKPIAEKENFSIYRFGIEKLFIMVYEITLRPDVASMVWSEFLRIFLMRYITPFIAETYYSYRDYLKQ